MTPLLPIYSDRHCSYSRNPKTGPLTFFFLKIPSVRKIAVQTEVNPNTVMRAYTSLQDLDIISNRRGIGYFVSESAFNRTHESKKVRPSPIFVGNPCWRNYFIVISVLSKIER
ncbi:MAG: GntR family transcriptional regulator [Chitinivibrionales bacterium]|nr:GntR family transcriptional regulator [Chitinivibrionales bacterium]